MTFSSTDNVSFVAMIRVIFAKIRKLYGSAHKQLAYMNKLHLAASVFLLVANLVLAQTKRLDLEQSLGLTSSLTKPINSVRGWADAQHYIEYDVQTGQTYQRSEEHTSELQSRENLVCRLLLEK